MINKFKKAIMPYIFGNTKELDFNRLQNIQNWLIVENENTKKLMFLQTDMVEICDEKANGLILCSCGDDYIPMKIFLGLDDYDNIYIVKVEYNILEEGIPIEDLLKQFSNEDFEEYFKNPLDFSNNQNKIKNVSNQLQNAIDSEEYEIAKELNELLNEFVKKS